MFERLHAVVCINYTSCHHCVAQFGCLQIALWFESHDHKTHKRTFGLWNRLDSSASGVGRPTPLSSRRENSTRGVSQAADDSSPKDYKKVTPPQHVTCSSVSLSNSHLPHAVQPRDRSSAELSANPH